MLHEESFLSQESHPCIKPWTNVIWKWTIIIDSELKKDNKPDYYCPSYFACTKSNTVELIAQVCCSGVGDTTRWDTRSHLHNGTRSHRWVLPHLNIYCYNNSSKHCKLFYNIIPLM